MIKQKDSEVQSEYGESAQDLDAFLVQSRGHSYEV